MLKIAINCNLPNFRRAPNTTEITTRHKCDSVWFQTSYIQAVKAPIILFKVPGEQRGLLAKSIGKQDGKKSARSLHPRTASQLDIYKVKMQTNV